MTLSPHYKLLLEQDHLPQQVEAGSSVELPFDLFDAVDGAFDAAGAPVEGESGCHGVEICAAAVSSSGQRARPSFRAARSSSLSVVGCRVSQPVTCRTVDGRGGALAGAPRRVAMWLRTIWWVTGALLATSSLWRRVTLVHPSESRRSG